MAIKVILLVLFALPLRESGAFSSREECTTSNDPELISFMRSIVEGHLERIRLMHNIAGNRCNWRIKDSIYEVLWQEYQNDNSSNDPKKLFNVYKAITSDYQVPETLYQIVYQAFTSRYLQLLSPPFYNNNRSAVFPEIETIVSQFKGKDEDHLKPVITTIFDDVRSKSSIECAANRLSNFNASLGLLTWANLELLNGTDVNSTVHTTLLDNLRYLLKQPNFNEEVRYKLRIQAHEQFPTDVGLLNIITTSVRFRLAFNENFYLWNCESEDYICVKNNQYSNFEVKRRRVNDRKKFSFSFIPDTIKYLGLDRASSSKSEKAKNVKNKDIEQWWYAEQVKDGVAFYDADTSSMVLCGNPTSGDDLQGYAYTRRADDFEAYAKECTWLIENTHLYYVYMPTFRVAKAIIL